jgi:hypothetical protein
MPSPDFPGKIGLKARKHDGLASFSPSYRLLGAALLVAVAAARCNTIQMPDAGALHPTATAAPSDTDWHHEADAAGVAYRSDPNNSQAAIRYA